MVHKPFLATVAEEIREPRGLRRFLVADDDRLIASRPNLVGPARMASNLAGEIGREIPHEVGKLARVVDSGD